MNDKTKARTIAIAGLPHSGKTSLICGFAWLLKQQKRNIAGFKPFENGLLQRNATETPSDAEIICRVMTGEPMENLVSPYIANEPYPIEMAFRRDGIRANQGFINERINLLSDLYHFTLIECPGSLFTPVFEAKMVYDWLVDLNVPVLWVIDPVQSSFEHNLAEIEKLVTLDAPVHLIFNNASKIIDQDLMFFIWEKIESIAGREAVGMIPFVKNLEDSYEPLAKRIEENIPSLIDELFSPDQDD